MKWLKRRKAQREVREARELEKWRAGLDLIFVPGNPPTVASMADLCLGTAKIEPGSIITEKIGD